MTFDRKILVSGSNDKTVKFWKKVGPKGFALFQNLIEHTDEVWKVENDDEGSLIFSASKDHTVIIWRRNEDSGYYQNIQTLLGHTGGVGQIDFGSDVKTLIT